MLTTRRFYIDRFLLKYEYLFQGEILDIGGTRVNPRGNYRFPSKFKNTLKVLNNNPKTNPNYLLSIEKRQNLDKKFDILVVNEILEYIDNIDNVFFNISNLSKKDSIIIIAWPWMNTFHGDKVYDLKRYSDIYISKKLKDIGFTNFIIESNGGIFSVIWDFIHRINNQNHNRILRKIINIFLFSTFNLVLKLDNYINTSDNVTTGFTLLASRDK